MKFGITAGLLATGLGFAQPAFSAPSLKVLFSFSGTRNGANPFGGLIQDSTGAFYGTTGSGGANGNGTVYKLTPPAAGEKHWTETVLYHFKGGDDGQNPDGALVMDSSGALYGTTQWGGVGGFNGTVFKLTPVAGKTAWKETVLYRFGDNDGTDPVSSLVLDPSGTLFGTACGCGIGTESKGTVFSLTPPAAGAKSWTYTVIHAFTGGNDGGLPYAGLVEDASGALYGATGGGGRKNAGTVYRLTPPKAGKTVWTETVLHSFSGGHDGAYPHGGVTLDPVSGALYGTTQGGGVAVAGNGFGVVYKVAPPASGTGAWAFSTLFAFTGKTDGAQPASGVILDTSGTIYGTTALGGNVVNCAAMPGDTPGCGVVYQLMPPAAGQTKWAETVLYAFSGGKDGNGPWSGLLGSQGTLYGTTELGGAHFAGEVYSISP
jgi:uncharacterized repeat protein (TIGR03803 family)